MYILNQINGTITRSVAIDPETINHNKLCYRCSNNGPDCLYGKLRIKDLTMKHIFPIKSSISIQIQMNMLFQTKDERKIRISDSNIHKAMGIPVDIHETNENLTVIVQQQNACKLEFADHLWLPFIEQPQFDIIVFAIINFKIYHILVSKCKHGINHIYIITFNDEL